MPTQSFPRPFVIRQLCTAGQQFTGAAPGTTPAWAGDVYAFPTSATAGLIDPSAVVYEGNKGAALRVLELALRMGSPTSWIIEHIDSGGNETVWLAGTTETDILATGDDCPDILPGDTLKLVTAGASTAQHVALTFAPLGG